LTTLKINILDTKSHALHETYTATVKQLCLHLVQTTHFSNHLLDFAFGQNNRDPFVAFSPNDIDTPL
jgi:hypothetical protein